ncbi:MAG: transglycosylase SLT domain-containing protein [Idiomarina sp.]
MLKLLFTARLFVALSVASSSVLLAPESVAGPQAAASAANSEQREQQRELFRKAEYAARRGRLNEYRLLLSQLGDYPLTPYLELERLQQVGYLANEDRVLEFLEAYNGTPLDWQLRQPWLDYLARNNEQARFLRDFKPPGTTEHHCYNLQFQFQQQLMPGDAFHRAVGQLWLTGESLPSACDKILNWWTEAGQRTPNKVWDRVKLAAEGGNHTLLPYLADLLPPEKTYLAHVYHMMRRDPSKVIRLSLFQAGQDTAEQAAIATYAYGRLIWRDPDLALQNWPAAEEFFKFSAEQLDEVTQKFALALSNKNHPESSVWQTKVPLHNASDAVLQWRLADLLRQQDFSTLSQLINQLPATVAQGNQWRYWQARALLEQGDELAAQALLQELAQERHYYGFMAAAHLQLPASLEAKNIEYSPLQLDIVRQHPAAIRAYEFLQMGRGLDARREWNYLLSQLTTEQQQHAAVLANEWEWHDQAIFGLAAIGHFDAVQLRFPLAYYDVLSSFSKNAGIDESWALAITRRESAFRADAFSSAGARGLMQILPSTAKYLHKQDVSRTELHSPNFNVRLGTRYLGELQTRMQDNWVLATASYNAGIYRVREWLPETAMPVDIWIETIPYKETREYVKNVLAYQQIYSMLLGDNRNLFNELVDMNIRR